MAILHTMKCVLYSVFERHRSVDQTESGIVLRSVYYVRIIYHTYIDSIHRGFITRQYIAYPMSATITITTVPTNCANVITILILSHCTVQCLFILLR